MPRPVLCFYTQCKQKPVHDLRSIVPPNALLLSDKLTQLKSPPPQKKKKKC